MMALCCYSDDTISVDKIRRRLKGALWLIDHYKWLVDAYMSDFFVHGLSSKVPADWWDVLLAMEPPQMADILKPQISQTSRVWPLSLLAFHSSVHSISLSNRPVPTHTALCEHLLRPDKTRPSNAKSTQADSCHGNGRKRQQLNGGKAVVQLTTSGTMTSDGVRQTVVSSPVSVTDGQLLYLDHCYRRHVKPKKQHEIATLALLLSDLCQTCHCQRVVDVGAGQGHLSRLLSFGYHLNVTTVEASGCHAPKAAKFDGEVKDDIRKEIFHRNKQRHSPCEDSHEAQVSRSPRHLVATIDHQDSIDDFLRKLELRHHHQDVIKQDVIKQDVIKQDIIKQDIIKQDVIKQDVIKQDVIKQDVIKQDVIKQDVIKQDIIKQDIIKQDVIKQDVIKQDVIKRDIIKQDVIKQDIIKPDVIKQDVEQPQTNHHKTSHYEMSECEARPCGQRLVEGDDDDSKTKQHETKRVEIHEITCLETSDEDIKRCDLNHCKSANTNDSETNHDKTKGHEINCYEAKEPEAIYETNHEKTKGDGKICYKTKQIDCDITKVHGTNHETKPGETGEKGETKDGESSQHPVSPERPGPADHKSHGGRSTHMTFDPDSSSAPGQVWKFVEPDDTFVLTGLHVCGDLTPTLIRVFVKCREVAALALVSCCYMKLSTLREHTSGDHVGYPMSTFTSQLANHRLSYEALEGACHFNDAYCRKLTNNSPELVSHAYRAALQEIVFEKCPSMQHGSIRLTMRKAHHMTFKSYAEVGLRRLGLETDVSSGQLERAQMKLTRWREVVAFFTLRLCVLPLVETVVLLDRMLFLAQNGVSSCLLPIFDPAVSPRNFVLLATKDRSTRA